MSAPDRKLELKNTFPKLFEYREKNHLVQAYVNQYLQWQTSLNPMVDDLLKALIDQHNALLAKHMELMNLTRENTFKGPVSYSEKTPMLKSNSELKKK